MTDSLTNIESILKTLLKEIKALPLGLGLRGQEAWSTISLWKTRTLDYDAKHKNGRSPKLSLPSCDTAPHQALCAVHLRKGSEPPEPTRVT